MRRPDATWLQMRCMGAGVYSVPGRIGVRQRDADHPPKKRRQNVPASPHPVGTMTGSTRALPSFRRSGLWAALAGGELDPPVRRRTVPTASPTPPTMKPTVDTVPRVLAGVDRVLLGAAADLVLAGVVEIALLAEREDAKDGADADADHADAERSERRHVATRLRGHRRGCRGPPAAAPARRWPSAHSDPPRG